ncbi:hypothetical protein F4806DRAFT_287563 [Annulohypoxylon nitens]|nr:hypothetical protein F4806DRAFT_287563 [Annulohypoxylon nitens]
MEQGNNPIEFPESDPFAERKVFLHQSKPSSKAYSKRDLEFIKYEDYLRSKYDCSEAMPAGFDPEKLEIVFQSQRKRKNENEELDMADPEPEVQSEDDDLSEIGIIEKRKECERMLNIIEPVEDSISYDSSDISDVSITESLDSDGLLDEYEKEAVIHTASIEKFTRVSPELGPGATGISPPTPISIVNRKSTPRIKTGSKPPLSRSAFAGAGLPSPEDGTPVPATLRGYPKAPQYFPYKKRKVRRVRSRDVLRK